MSVLLIVMNSYNNSFNSEHLGCEQLLAQMRLNDIDADICHIQYSELNSDEALEKVKEINFSDVLLVGFSMTYDNITISKKLIDYINSVNKAIHITCGGNMASQSPLDVLELCDGLDSVIVGEGEITICELHNSITHNLDLSLCDGLVWRGKNGEILVNKERQPILDLDSIPRAERVMLKKNAYSFARIQTSRGCKARCAFCAESKLFNNWRGHSPEYVVDEMEYLNGTFNISTFVIIDNSFEDPYEPGKKRIEQIAKLILKKGLNIEYRVLCRAESFSEKDLGLLNLLKESGLNNVYLGIESGYEPTLRLFQKRTTVETSINTLQMFDSLQIPVQIGFIMFHPWSTPEETEVNIQFLKKIKRSYILDLYYHKLMIFKNTVLYDKALAEGLLTEDFSILNPFGYTFVHPQMRQISDAVVQQFQLYENNFYIKNILKLVGYSYQLVMKKKKLMDGSDSKKYIDFIDKQKDLLSDLCFEQVNKALNGSGITDITPEQNALYKEQFMNINNTIKDIVRQYSKGC